MEQGFKWYLQGQSPCLSQLWHSISSLADTAQGNEAGGQGPALQERTGETQRSREHFHSSVVSREASSRFSGNTKEECPSSEGG